MALIEEDPVDDPFDHLVDRGVLEDDVRALAAELEREVLVTRRGSLLNQSTDVGRPRERDLVDARMVDELAEVNVNVDMIVQNEPTEAKGLAEISFTIPREDLRVARGL